MPIKKAAYKALRKSKTRHLRNITIKSELKTLIKKAEKCITEKKADDAKNLLKALSSKLNKAASKGIIHKNTASRKISRLFKKLNALGKA